MIWFLAWLVAVELLALSVLPMAVRLFRPLPDRGFIFAKPLGILVVTYLCWLLGVFGVLRFQQATIAVVLVAVAVACWAAWGRQALRELAPMRTVIWTSEALFLLFFAVAALIRAHNPEISGTEKPMDFALMNALYRGETFPAEDPWMSGLSISYYYFGYLLLAMVAKLSGVPASVGYNLGVALVFALLLAGSYSLALNLLSALRLRWRLAQRLAAASVAPLVVGVMGNLEIGLEVLAARGMGDAAFWKAAGIKGLQVAAQPGGWFPTTHWWWWRAARVVPNTKPDGINEFPYFSFLLGDLHPHYAILPWALLAVALSLAALMGRWGERPIARKDWLFVAAPALALGVLLVGNSWDFPTYTALFWAATLVPVAVALTPTLSRGGESEEDGPSPRPSPAGRGREEVRGEGEPQDSGPRTQDSGPRTQDSGPSTQTAWWGRYVPVLKRLALISVCSVLLYSPFLLGFSSQTKGVGLSDDKTPLASLLIIFGPFLFALACFLAWRAWPPGDLSETPRARRVSWLLLAAGGALIVSSGVVGSGALLVGLLVLVGASVRREWGRRQEPAPTGQGLARRQESDPTEEGRARRQEADPTEGQAEGSGGERPSGDPRENPAPIAGGEGEEPGADARRFLLLLAAGGLMLVLVPEFVFLVDLFGTRMNTVFKFHYQAWLLLGLASAVGVAWMAGTLRPLPVRGLVVAGFALLVGVGLLYPLGATPSKTRGFQGSPTIDGAAYYQAIRPDDYSAIQWLTRAAVGRPVVLEATGGEYSEYARVSTFSGLPTVLGWAGHEGQWGRRGEDLQRRSQDIDAMYKTADRAALLGLLDKYQVEYVFVGSLEQDRYGPEVANRFEGLLEPANRQGKVVVYRVPTRRHG